MTFEPDNGGWNNIRMGIECVLVLAHYLRRTLVLPPPQSLYLIAKTYGDRRDFGLADFLNTSLLASHPGWRTKTMPECPRFPDDLELLKKMLRKRAAGQQKRAKFPTSKAHISAVFHSFRLIFGRANISRNGLEAWMLFPERARAKHSRLKRR